MELIKVINNVSERVVDDLKTKLSKGSRVSIAAASFSIYAFEALKEELENVDELRFIFTSPTFIKDKVKKEKREFFIPKLNRERNLYGSDFEIKLRNKMEQKAIAKECANWIRRKVKFKSNVSQESMGGFIHVNGTAPYAYAPFNEFTTTELGCERGNSLYSMVQVVPSPFAEQYLNVFNEQWKNGDKFEDVTAKVLEYIETVYQENAPEFIYFITLYNIFSEFLDDINEDVLPNEKTGFRESVIWKKLYNFQKDAALAIINKLEKYNGCILADVDDDDDDLDIMAVGEKKKENRYQRLMNKVIRAGIKTKVLMLSATPVNNRFNDLKNQLQLAYEGHAEQINEVLDIDRSIDDVVAIKWLYKLAPSILNVADGKEVHEIVVFSAQLKSQDCPDDVFLFIDRNMPRHVVFILEYEGQYKLLLNYKEWLDATAGTFRIVKSFASEWLREADLSLPIQGLTMDAIYENMAGVISGYGTSNSEETKRMVVLESLIQKGRKEIAALQKLVRTEKQFNRQLELNNEARALKKKVAEWEKEINEL